MYLRIHIMILYYIIINLGIKKNHQIKDTFIKYKETQYII